jgi:3-hydroxyacyl-CoA dehydrogenase
MASSAQKYETIECEIRDGVAFLRINNPPINGLGYSTRLGIVKAISTALEDNEVKSIVVAGAGKMFSGGADIREFNTPDMIREPTLRTVIDILENSRKPVIAAIDGAAMGGAFELVLACNYRVASPGAQVGLPEVKLGLLPGAGGTQRLPRLAGLELGLNMIVSGSIMDAKRLAGTPVFDEIIEGDLSIGAIEFAKKIVARGGPHPRVRDREIEHDNAEGLLQFSRQAVTAAAKNHPAPRRCIDAIEAAVKKPFEEGLREERDLFIELLNSTESKALRHVFFAERAASKISDVPENTPVRPITAIAVLGAGTMGSGIAMNFLNAAIPVTILEVNQEALDRGISVVRRNYENSAQKGKLTVDEIGARMSLLNGTLSFADIRNADLIIEAVFEELGVKETVFRILDNVAKEGAILATNTSTLDLNKIASFTKRAEDVVGMHFFSPANVMRLLEVVRGEKTAKDVLATVMRLAKKIGKIPVVSGVCDGFIGNRMIDQYFRQAGFLLEEGSFPEEVDRAIEEFGFAMGPFRVGDVAGNDIGWAIRKRRRAEHPERPYPRIADVLCEQGRFGQKTAAGWYEYQAGDRKARPSEFVRNLIIENSKSLGINRRRITAEEIVERLVFSLINEGAKILEEGIAARASDIDIVYLNGYGFPPWRGGPMFYADTIGLYNVLRGIRKYHRGLHGEVWDVADLLVRLSEQGKGFGS